MVQFNRTHSFSHFKFTKQNFSIFQIYALYFGKISSELCKIHSIRSHTPQMMQNSHHLFTHLPYVSDACPSRELSEIPANQAKFAPFTHKFRELHAFRTKIHPHLVHYFQISSHRQRTPENWSESTRFRAVHPQLL